MGVTIYSKLKNTKKIHNLWLPRAVFRDIFGGKVRDIPRQDNVFKFDWRDTACVTQSEGYEHYGKKKFVLVVKKSGQIVEMYTESPKANDQKKSKSFAQLLWNDFCALVIRTPMLIMEMEVLRKEDKVDAQDLLRDNLNASYSTLYTAFIHLATNI